MTDPYECWLRREDVPGFLHRLSGLLAFDLDDVLDRLLDTDVGRGRWLVLPAAGPVHLELAGEPGTGAVEVRARPTGPDGDALVGSLLALGALPGR